MNKNKIIKRAKNTLSTEVKELKNLSKIFTAQKLLLNLYELIQINMATKIYAKNY